MKRPLSAQHSKTSFGEFYMTKKLDIIPKVSNYRIDGSGRDGYINSNNGGNSRSIAENGWCKYTSKRGYLNNFTTKNYNVISKVNIYKSDGNGRDQYIVRDCGGFYKEGSKAVNPHTFRTSLRNYESKPTRIAVNNFSELCKNHLLKSTKEKLIETSKKQRVQSARLSVPKKVNSKYVHVL
jgi:hypothetical protein